MSTDSIRITLPDNNTKEFSNGITGMSIAESISAGLARLALSITVNGELWDLDRPITEDASIQLHTWDNEEGKYTFWHSSAHLLAEAIQELFPSAKFGIGPPIENGFYYDVDFGDHTLQQEDLRALEKKFLELARQKNKFLRTSISKSDALTYYQKIGNEYKVDLIEGLEDGQITFYEQGNFTDLCRGPHVPNTGIVKAVALTSIAGAYWRGDVDSKQLTRIYGISFPKQKLLEEYLNQIEEAKKRDHRKLGKEMGIYMIDKMVGSGLPLWLPKGTTLRRTLEAFLRDEQIKRGNQEQKTPHITKIKKYKT